MQLFFTIVYIRIITLTRIFHDHPLVEYPLYLDYGNRPGWNKEGSFSNKQGCSKQWNSRPSFQI